jgi:large subunit ribosomal protein L25
MKTIDIKGTVRETVGKTNSKKLRRENHIPCVVYGRDGNIHFAVHENEVRKLVYTPNVHLLNLLIGDKTYPAIMKDIQFHPVTDKILHIDFINIYEGEKVEIRVPVNLLGFAEGVKQGGKLNLHIRRLKVRAFAYDLPDSLDIEITGLTLGKSVKISELAYDNLELLDPRHSVVASVKLTRAARGLAEEEAEAEAALAALEGEEGAEAEGAAAAE